MAVLSEFQQALERRDFGEAQRLRDLRTPIEAGTYEGWFSGDDDKIGLAGKTIQPIFIYPKVDMGNERDSGNFVDTGKNKYIWTGNWQLTDEQHREFDKNVKRALSETGLGVLPTKVKNSRKLLREWQSENDRHGIVFPEEELGVASHHMSEGVVPYYIVRGMGGYAGAFNNPEFNNPFSLVGDTVIEALAGFEGLTSYARILMDGGMSEDEAKYMASRQSQMGTVLHEAMHMTGALPHTANETMVQDYSTNYGGEHGEEFMHAISADIRGERSEDVGQAMRLVMGEQWNYGWGTDANPDGVVAEPVTSNQEFQAIAQAPEHQHPHRVEFAHESPEQTIPTSLDPIPISKTPEPIESKEDMAKVPFRKNANGQWEVFGNGQWQSTPELQQVLQDVESVREVKASDGSVDYEFLYGSDPGGITGGPTGIWTLDDIERRYNEAVLASGGSQVTPSGSPAGGGAADLYESWYSVNTTTLPDMYMRDDAGDIIMNEEYIDSAGNTVPAQPVIDPDKMERVIEILRQQGAWEIQEPTVFSVPGVQDNFVRVGDKIFKSSPPEPVAKEYQPGVVPEKGPGSINLPGYDILQDREGGLTPYAERYKPTYHLDTTTMTPFIQQPDGSLEVADVPTIDELITQYLVTGQSEKAVAMANFRDRPSPIEYFQAAMEWARTPADIFTVSAIVRGMFEPELGEIGDVRRVGAPPSWARDAWIALQSSMGVPAQNMSSEPGDAEGSFVAKGGDASVVSAIQSEFGIGNIEPTDSNVSAADAEALFQETGVLAKDSDMAAAGDADDLFSGLGFGPGDSGPYGTGDTIGLEGGTVGDGAIQGGDMGGGSLGNGFTEGETLTATVTLYDEQGNPVNVQENLVEGLLLGGRYGETPDWNVVEEPTNFDAFYSGIADTMDLEESFVDVVPTTSPVVSNYDPFYSRDTSGDDFLAPVPAETSVASIAQDTGPQVGVDYSGGSPVFGTVGNLPMTERERSPGSQAALVEEYWDTGGSPFQRTAEADIVYEQFPEDDAYALQYEPTQEEIIEEYWDTGGSPFERATPLTDYGSGDDYYDDIGFLQEPTQADIIEEYWEPIGSPVERGAEPPPQTFTVPAEPVDVVGWDTGMTASELGSGRELVFDEPVVSNYDPFYSIGARVQDGADGMRTDNRLSLVGESGPELALFPNGTEIIPLDREMKPDQKRRLRRRGVFSDAIDSFQFGGMVGGMGPEVSDLPDEAQVMPAGVTEMLTGRPTRRPRSLFRAAGLRAPSAQTISNLIPSEIEAYRELALTKGGIGQEDFEREFRSMVPMGQGGTSQARFTPRSIGRTRYGSR